MGVNDPVRELLRHAVATVAYRAAKACRGAPPGFGDFRPAEGSRSAGEILAHMGDLYDWALHVAQGNWIYRTATPLPWEKEIGRFHESLRMFDAYLASDAPLGFPAETLLQGPIADSLTHTGQMAQLRRLAGSPVRGESYARAEITRGRVGSDQAAPRVEFD